MPRTRTLAELRTEVRQRANMENSQFVTDAEITRYLNESISELYDMVVCNAGQEWYLKNVTFPTVVGQHIYSIAAAFVPPTVSDFYMLRGVDVESQPGVHFPIRPYNFEERHALQPNGYPVWFPYDYVRYRLLGNATVTGAAPAGVYTPQIRFDPAPSVVRNITLWYIPTAPVLSADTDVWDGFNGWEEYAIVDSAIKCLEKEESDTSALEMRKERLIKRIEGMAPAHDVGFPERTTDMSWVNNWTGYDGWFFSW